jgi:tetratricopeptide (TPR) repeat protein
MSLVNDVLRQIDEKTHSQEEMKAALPLSLQQGNHDRDKTQVIILSLTALILVVYLFQLFFIGSLNKENVQVSAPNFAPIERDQVLLDVIVEPEVITAISDPVVSKTTVSKPIASEPIALKAGVDVLDSEIIKDVKESKPKILLEKPVRISPAPVKRVEELALELEKPVISKKISNPQDVQYQEALGQFIAGNIDKSERILKNILNKNVKEKYLELQARIYIKKSDASSFYQLVKNHPENNGISWYKLIAPGLQLFSYYQLSNQYYDALIKIEPNQIRWQLAMALNYSRLGKSKKAVVIYSNLASSDYVSDRQKKWLLKKIKRLTLSKA